MGATFNGEPLNIRITESASRPNSYKVTFDNDPEKTVEFEYSPYNDWDLLSEAATYYVEDDLEY